MWGSRAEISDALSPFTLSRSIRQTRAVPGVGRQDEEPRGAKQDDPKFLGLLH